MSKTLREFNALPKKTATLTGKIVLPEDMVGALRYIEANTEANKSLIIQEALAKYGIVQKAKTLKEELGSKKQTKV